MSDTGSTAITLVRGWPVMMDGDEPRIQDEELGRRLGFGRLARIRDLIKSLARTGKLKDIRIVPASRRIEIRRGVFREQVVNEFWLTKKQALKVIINSKTKLADKVQDEMIDVFEAVTSGRFVPRWVAVPVPQNAPTLGDLHRPEIKKLCKDVADRLHVTQHQVQGWARTPYGASGIYLISSAHYGPVVKRLTRWLKGHELPPTPARRLLDAPDPAQYKLPFPGSVQ